MDTLLKANIFFIITSIAVIIVTVFVCAVLYQLMRVLQQVRILSKKIESNINDVSDDVKDTVRQISASRVFNFIFPKRRKK